MSTDPSPAFGSVDRMEVPHASLEVEAAALDADDPLASYRDAFVGAETPLVYFDGNSLGRPPRATAERLSRFVTEEWGGRLIRGWDEAWMELPFAIGDRIGSLALGAAPGQTVIGDSTTVLLYKLIRAALDAQSTADPERVEIVVGRDDFPTDRYLVEGIAAERGARVVWVEVDTERGVDADLLRDAVGARIGQVGLQLAQRCAEPGLVDQHARRRWLAAALFGQMQGLLGSGIGTSQRRQGLLVEAAAFTGLEGHAVAGQVDLGLLERLLAWAWRVLCGRRLQRGETLLVAFGGLLQGGKLLALAVIRIITKGLQGLLQLSTAHGSINLRLLQRGRSGRLLEGRFHLRGAYRASRAATGIVARQTGKAMLMAGAELVGPGALHGGFGRRQADQVDAVHRAGGDAQLAARAFIGDHRVHQLGGADDGVHRAGLDAFGAADALGLANHRHLGRRGGQGQRQFGHLQQIGQGAKGRGATGWTLVDRLARGDAFGVRQAAGVAALAALRLRQQGVDGGDALRAAHGRTQACRHGRDP